VPTNLHRTNGTRSGSVFVRGGVSKKGEVFLEVFETMLLCFRSFFGISALFRPVPGHGGRLPPRGRYEGTVTNSSHAAWHKRAEITVSSEAKTSREPPTSNSMDLRFATYFRGRKSRCRSKPLASRRHRLAGVVVQVASTATGEHSVTGRRG